MAPRHQAGDIWRGWLGWLDDSQEHQGKYL